jgi:hypothetical protein
MTRLGKLVETISHLKFNVALARAFVKEGNCFTPKAITMVGACIMNPKGLGYSKQWTRTSRRRRLCVVCKKKVNWYCPTCDDTTICFGAYFVKLHSTCTYYIICNFSEGLDQCYEY